MTNENNQSFSESLAKLVEGYTVAPDPKPEDQAADDSALRWENERIAIERGCPAKLAREVSKNKPGHRYQSTQAGDVAMGWLAIGAGKDHRDVLTLCGERGLGKSYAAALVLANAEAPPGAGRPRWANARHVADWMHASADPAAAKDLRRAKMASMLVLDDLGWEHFDRAGYTRSAIIGFIDDRIQSELRTVITTNMSEAEFRRRYTDALHDRIRGYGVWVDVESGPSMR